MSKASRKLVVKLNIGNNASTVWQQLRINTIGTVIHYTVPMPLAWYPCILPSAYLELVDVHKSDH